MSLNGRGGEGEKRRMGEMLTARLQDCKTFNGIMT
jgi:hypothetical protein